MIEKLFFYCIGLLEGNKSNHPAREKDNYAI